MTPLLLSVVVPAFNEEQRIAPTLRDIDAWLSSRTDSWEVLVVDDGSTDGTCRVVEDLAATLPKIRLIRSSPNRGKGHVVRQGMLTARGELRLFMDADNSVPISQLPPLLEAVERGADLAIASRRAPGARSATPAPWYRRVWSRFANMVVQFGLLDGIRDTQCGFKLFRAAAAEELFRRGRACGWGFDMEALALARRLGLRIAELPVQWRDDPRSRVNPLVDAWRISVEFLRIRRAIRRGGADLQRPRRDLPPASQVARRLPPPLPPRATRIAH